MAPPTEKVLVFGATGVIGRYIVKALVHAQPPFKRIGIYTSANTVEKKAAEIQSLKDKGAEVIVGDFNDEAKILETYKGPHQTLPPRLLEPFVAQTSSNPSIHS